MSKQKAKTDSVATYTLNEKALELASSVEAPGFTLQTPDKGLGKAWRAAGHKAPNTRVYALATILANCGETFTQEQAEAALKAARDAKVLNLGTGSPRSYAVAFVKNGYFAQA